MLDNSLLLILGGVFSFFLFLLFLLGSLSNTKRKKQSNKLKEISLEEKDQTLQNKKVSKSEVMEILENTKDIIKENPKTTAKIIQHWLKEENQNVRKRKE